MSGGGLNDTIQLRTFAGGRVYGDGVGVTTAGTGTGGAADGADSISTTVAATAATSIYGGGGADTINISSGALNLTQINGGNGADSIRFAGSADGVITTFNSVNGGAGADTISVGTQINGFSAIGGVGTINGGAGSDLVIIQAASGVTASSMATSTLTALTNVGFVIAGAGSGDVIRIGNNAVVTAAITQTNWAAATPQINIYSALSTFSADQVASAGSVSVFSDGTDSLITISSNAAGTSLFTIFVDGKDLTATSLFGNVLMTASNVGFSVTGAGTEGLNITFS